MTNLSEVLRQVRLALQNQDYPTAIRGLEQAAQAAREAGDRAAEGRHLGNLGLIYHRIGQTDQALACFEDALEAARAENDRLTEDGLLGNMGNILREVGRFNEAIQYLNQALLIAQEVGDTRGRGIWLSNLGLVYDDFGQPEQAMALHERAVAVARELQDRRGLAIRLGNLGNSEVSLGAYERAIAAFAEAAPIYRELGDQAALAQRLGVIGNLYARLAREAASRRERLAYFAQALGYYGQTLEIAYAAGDPLSAAELTRAIGGVQLELGARDQAAAALDSAAQQYAALGRRDQAQEIRTLLDGLRGTVDNGQETSG